MKAEYKDDMFIVINRKHIDELKGNAARTRILSAVERFVFDYKKITGKDLSNKYFVVNRDEPYSDRIIRMILEGEDEKFCQTCDLYNIYDESWLDLRNKDNCTVWLCGDPKCPLDQ